MRWEYKYETHKAPKKKEDPRSIYEIEAEWLTAQGAEGWRLKDKVYFGMDAHCLFERRIDG